MCAPDASAPYSAYLSDMWAGAVCLWIFVFGQLPFYHPDLFPLFELIRYGALFFCCSLLSVKGLLIGHTLSRQS
jgi:hypothetical protein